MLIIAKVLVTVPVRWRERRLVTRAQRDATDPDLGVLSGRLLFAVQRELFATLATHGFDDLKHGHAERVGERNFRQFKRTLIEITAHQRGDA